MRHIKIRHPEWLAASNPQSSIDLYKKDKLPESIAGWMIVTSLKHPLRAVYGSNLAAAWHLLLEAIVDYPDQTQFTGLRIWLWRAVRLFGPNERDYWIANGIKAEELDEMDKLDEELALEMEARRPDTTSEVQELFERIQRRLDESKRHVH